MASGLFLDPVALLRAAPLVTTSFSLWFCADQDLFYGNFVRAENRQKGSEMLPQYWKSILTPSLARIFGLYLASAGAGLANSTGALGRAATALGTRRWYLAGAALSLCHFLFVPFVAPLIRSIAEDERPGKAWVAQERWLRVHRLRSLTVDLGGWACFLVAVVKGLETAAGAA